MTRTGAWPRIETAGEDTVWRPNVKARVGPQIFQGTFTVFLQAIAPVRASRLVKSFGRRPKTVASSGRTAGRGQVVNAPAARLRFCTWWIASDLPSPAEPKVNR